MLRKLLFLLYLAVAVAAPIAPAQADRMVGEGVAALHRSAHPSTRRSGFLAEAIKQAAEQPLHFAMSAGPIWLSRCLTAVPWYGWAMVPALAYREWRQWPSKRWWDPVLDAAFLALGALTATWSARPTLALALRHRRDRRTARAHFGRA